MKSPFPEQCGPLNPYAQQKKRRTKALNSFVVGDWIFQINPYLIYNLYLSFINHEPSPQVRTALPSDHQQWFKQWGVSPDQLMAMPVSQEHPHRHWHHRHCRIEYRSLHCFHAASSSQVLRIWIWLPRVLPHFFWQEPCQARTFISGKTAPHIQAPSRALKVLKDLCGHCKERDELTADVEHCCWSASSILWISPPVERFLLKLWPARVRLLEPWAYLRPQDPRGNLRPLG